MTGPVDIAADDLAHLVGHHVESALLAFDVDGMLAPLADHADEAELRPGVLDGLVALAARTDVAIVSGRTLESLDRLFAFPPALHVIGSHGLEIRGHAEPTLDDDAQYTFGQLEIIGTRGVDAAGPGAWLEYKPASVVLHTAAADLQLAEPAIEAVTNLAQMIDGAHVDPGGDVVELLARTPGTGEALIELAARLGRSPVVYLGDDDTGEDVFRMMSEVDVSVRVGAGDSAARFRLHGPEAVATFIASLA